MKPASYIKDLAMAISRFFPGSPEHVSAHALLHQSDLFDEKFYQATYGVSGRRKAIKHYLSSGWRLGFDPSKRFNTLSYLRLNPDVSASGYNPLEHYLRHGQSEGRKVWAEGGPRTFRQDGCDQSERSLADPAGDELGPILPDPQKTNPLLREWFSEEYYLSHYPDIARARVDPLSHYIGSGWKEHRNPSERFDTAYYLSLDPEVGRRSVCPLTHFVNKGRAEFRPPLPPDRLIFDVKLGSDKEFWSNSSIRIGVHAHVFFPELIGELYLALSNLPCHAHVRFTTIREGDTQYVNTFVKHKKPSWSFDTRTASPRGRDIGPLFQECSDLWKSTDYMLHIHTKRSLHTLFGNGWRQYLFDQCLGSPELLDKIFETFESDPVIAMLYPENFYEIKKFVGMNGNESALQALLRGLGHAYDVGLVKDYAAGSMAWFRSKAYEKLVAHLTSYEAFGGKENIEGTIAHVLERAFAAVPLAAGLKVRSYATPTRVGLDYSAVTRSLPIYREAHTDRWMRDTPRIAVGEPKALSPRTVFFNAQSLNIHWIIPSFGPGAGGHMTIFRFVEFFEQFGHRQTIWIQNALNYATPIDALRTIREHYRPIGDAVFVRFLPACVEQLSGDVLIATDCWTAYPAVAATNFKERFYFIQDHESQFHPAGANQLVIEQTYQFGFAALCAGPWLHKKAKDYGMWARQWDLAVDKTHYFPTDAEPKPSKRQVIQIAYYARANTPRRAVELGLAAFERLADLGYRFHVHFFGSEEKSEAQGYDSTDHGILAPAELGELYRRCDIGVVFSATNYSLVPLEMMACRLPVVELDTESTRAVFSENEVVMARPTPPAVAKCIGNLIDDPDLRKQYGLRGAQAASKFRWEDSARRVEAALFERLLERGFKKIDPLQICSPQLAKCRKASVFIPVKDGGAFFSQVIDRILAQRTDFEFDFLVIDSGSTDGTLDLLKAKAKADPKFRYEEIPQREFQHGRTRNLGISRTDGAYVAVTTADALPADDQWLARLVGGFSKGKRVAGVTGRHLAYPEHGPYLARDIDGNFDNFRNLGDVYSFDRPLCSIVYPGGVEWQMIAQFYSDNNSAMSRAVWKIHPYPEINWGEDMVWAWEALKLGFEKVYVDDAAVYHSHEWDLRRSEDWYAVEGKFWREFFGFTIVENVNSELTSWNGRDRIFALENRVAVDRLDRQLKLNAACLRGRARGAESVET